MKTKLRCYCEKPSWHTDPYNPHMWMDVAYGCHPDLHNRLWIENSQCEICTDKLSEPTEIFES